MYSKKLWKHNEIWQLDHLKLFNLEVWQYGYDSLLNIICEPPAEHLKSNGLISNFSNQEINFDNSLISMLFDNPEKVEALFGIQL